MDDYDGDEVEVEVEASGSGDTVESPVAVVDGPHMNVFWSTGMLAHNAGDGMFDTLHDPGFLAVLDSHPESPERIINILSILKKGPIAPYISWHDGEAAELEELTTFHSPAYVRDLLDAHKAGGKTLCGGTRINHGSWKAVLLAAGTTRRAMRYILEGLGKLAYALVRPPGHHAQPTRADGYCFLNNAALAVQLAIDMDVKKVAVVDIDVHYGNGTAEGFYSRKDVFTISLHMNHGSWGDSHPQTGQPDEVGVGAGIGYNFNIPLPNGTGDKGYEYAFKELVVPALANYKPAMLVVTFGQDASAFDPNGRQCLTMDGFRTLGRLLKEQADIHTDGKLLLVQEGGYHVTYSAYCVHGLIEGVLQLPEELLSDPMGYYIEEEAPTIDRVEEIKEIFSEAIAAAKSELKKSETS
ncbi:protein MpHDAC10 [Marchantia polymorpha subsp. ruderalis]|uniref:Histone deacetylase domain-containing protein n=2 Tax=Marchantia polymorpha TaxID=3197 RepID=A0AAF6B9H5_MARPO|nr:hypothetical protein MARPO_0214s0003 [Marchantia polymorpha]BBN08659.1 hypothetical protein Mp_4g13370 [Marchantia polymorpha subsp. ruderalis]|eukprot:PTQ27176.1 hypothetical protein MARPO_0214s0003 [Marchantia polymorpha]